ncbi:MAG: LD-carboxypeptidase [Clostridium sp.]
MLKPNDTVAILGCSNPLSHSNYKKVQSLKEILNSLNINVELSPYLFDNNSSPKHRGEIFNKYMQDSNIKIIFDISGGDLCNETLEYIDFNSFKNNKTLYCGYSDNSVIINALYKKSNLYSLNYQLTRLVGEDSQNQLSLFKDTFLSNSKALTNFNYNWISQNKMSGIVLGGNLRCTLKLAGTEYLPDFNNSILFLESLGGDYKKVITYFTQYKHMGIFSKINGIILGEFTELERENGVNAPIEILKSIIDISKIPVIKTQELGHSQISKAIEIGEFREFL